MRVLDIAYYTILRNIKDKKRTFMKIFIPIVIILLVGTALKREFQVGNINVIKVCYFDEDKSNTSGNFNEFLASEDVQKYLRVEEVKSYEEGEKLVKDKAVTSFIYIHKGFEQNVSMGNKADIQVIGDKTLGFKETIIMNIVDSFVNSANTMGAIVRLGENKPTITNTKTIIDTPINNSGKVPGSMDYYAVTILVMTLMRGALYGSEEIGEDLFEVIGKRMKSTPVKNMELLIGKAIGAILNVFLEGTIIIAFTKFVYHVNWGNNLGMILLICLSLSVLSTIFGALVCLATGDIRSASSVIGILVQIFTFVSGGYVLITADDKIFALVQHLMPNYLAQTAIFDSIYSGPINENYQFFNTNGYIIAMWSISLLLLVITAFVGRRKYSDGISK
jgi:ABC-2 type transport system permease protein